MDINEEAMSLHNSIFLDFLEQDEEKQKYKGEKHIIEMCYNNGHNSNVSIASIDCTNNRRPCFPPSANALLGSRALDLDPTTIRYSRPPSAAAEAFLSAAATEMLQNRQRRMRSLSSSRGSSPSPLSPIDNFETPPSRSPTAFRVATPAQAKVVGEEVLVMDGILVDAPPNRAAVTRSSLDSSATIVGNNLYKTEICRAWEDAGTCRYGSKCQFAHGKEEQRPARHPKFKPETCRSFVTMGGCPFRSTGLYSHPLAGRPIKNSETQVETNTAAATTSAAEVAPPTVTKTEAEEMITSTLVEADAEDYINEVLYGPALRRPRLPVFVEMCPQ